MKHFATLILIALLSITSSCTCDEKSSLTASTIETAVAEFNQLMITPKAQSFESFCSDALSYGHSSGLTQNKAEFINDVVNGPYHFTSVTSPDLSISISGNTGIARFVFLATAIKDAQQIDIRIGCVQVYQLDQNNQLKLLARQAYKLPAIKKN